MDEIFTPLNHREIEYNAKKLSGCDIPDSFLYKSDQARALFDWVSQTGSKVFDDDLIMDYGTDCLRLYLLFENTPKEHDAPFYESWNEGALEGMYKFLGRYRRMILAASVWNRRGGYCSASEKSIETMNRALEQTKKKIAQCLSRENTMPNRHNFVSALMELLNVLQRELKIGEIVTQVRKHAVSEAVPKKAWSAREDGSTGKTNVQIGNNEAVMRICREFIILMAPVACDLSRMLWMEIGTNI